MSRSFLPTTAIPIQGRDRQLVPRESIKRLRAKRICLSASILSLMVGSVFLGFSIINVPSGSVGYYTCNDMQCSLDLPGIYFKYPWTRHEFKTVSISPKNITIGRLQLTTNGTTRITDKICLSEYIIEDIQTYLHSLDLFKTEQMMTTALIDEIKPFIISQLNNANSQFNLTISMYGLTFTRFYL